MWANGKALILSTVLQASTHAWADNTTPQNPTVPVVPNTSAHALPRINYLNFHLPGEVEKTGATEPSFRIEGRQATEKVAPLRIEAPNGLHLTVGDPHPGLEYKFSENGTVRLHLGKSRTTATAGWSF